MAKRDYSHFDIFRQMELEMQRFTEEAFQAVLFHPRVDMFETEEALIVKIEIAGVQPDRLNITLAADNRTLTIAGERGERPDERRERILCHQLEIYYGAFERRITLPGGIPIDRDQIKATYREGFLVLALPKQTGSAPETHTIEITNE